MRDKYYVASVSGGVDSTAMLCFIIDNNMPLDEVVFFDTGVEFYAVHKVMFKISQLCMRYNIKFTRLKSPVDFVYAMCYVNGWCNYCNRWGTSVKIRTINDYLSNIPNCYQYIGYLCDEYFRVTNDRQRSKKHLYPLYDYGYNKYKAFKLAQSFGFDWIEPNGVRLYDVLNRVSCWCCGNKNVNELYNIWKYLPSYWKKLKFMQSINKVPFKEYGSIDEIEHRFEHGYKPW